MTPKEIIRMAREAGFLVDNVLFLESVSLFERFAALVAEPWIETNKALVKEIIELQKQAEQEPVATIRIDYLGDAYIDDYVDLPTGEHDVYTAPVRTKDLTDDEVAKAYMECTGGDIIARCRAVIAAYKEKNNANNNT